MSIPIRRSSDSLLEDKEKQAKESKSKGATHPKNILKLRFLDRDLCALAHLRYFSERKIDNLVLGDGPPCRSYCDWNFPWLEGSAAGKCTIFGHE